MRIFKHALAVLNGVLLWYIIFCLIYTTLSLLGIANISIVPLTWFVFLTAIIIQLIKMNLDK